MKSTVDNYEEMHKKHYIYTYIYKHSVCFFLSCPLLIPLCDLLLLTYVVFQSTLINYADPCRDWTFQSIARLAEKKERNGVNKKSDTRMDLNPGPRLVAPMLYPLSDGAFGQNLNFNPYELSNLKFILLPSLLHVNFLST